MAAEISLSPLPAIPLWFMEEGPLYETAISTRVRLARNLSGYPFPGRIGAAELAEVDGRVRKALDAVGQELDGMERDWDEIPRPVQRMLEERRLVSSRFSDHPGGRFLLRADQRLSVQLNFRDHLHIAAMGSGLDLKRVWEDADRLDSRLESSLGYAHSLELGYLTSDITQAGTGLRASVMVHLPALSRSHFLDRALGAVTQMGFSVRGFFGTEESFGEMYILANEVALGLSEEEILKGLDRVVRRLDGYEQKVRRELVSQEQNRWEERIYRAWSELNQNRNLTQEETISHLSALRLGAVLGWFDYLPLKDITMLFTFAQKGHILNIMRDDEDEGEARARIVRAVLNRTYGEEESDV